MDNLIVASTMATAMVGATANMAIAITVSKDATATLRSIIAGAAMAQVTVGDMVMVGRA